MQYSKRAKMVITPLQENAEVQLGFAPKLSLKILNGMITVSPDEKSKVGLPPSRKHNPKVATGEVG